MGSGNSKPDNVSDEAWERTQTEKFQRISEKENELQLVREKYKNDMVHMAVGISNYCDKCHNVPKILMLLPSYRNECNDARLKLLFNLTELIDDSNSEQATSHIINFLK